MAEPRNLTRVLDAFNDVLNGRITPVVTDDGYREHRSEGFSLLFAANVKK